MPRPTHLPTLLAAFLVTAAMATACGGPTATTAETADVDPLATAVPITTETIPASPRPDPQPGTIEDEGPGTHTTPRPDPRPGTVEDEGPGTGSVPTGDTAPSFSSEVPSTYRVTAVAADDVLHVRADPDPGAMPVGQFAADAIDINSTGRIAHNGDQLWREVEVPNATVGWVNARFLEVQTRS